MADTFILKGDINALDASATFSGTVTVTPSKRFTLGNSEYPIAPVTVSLNSDGEYEVPNLVLPDSNNVSPQNFTYRLNYAAIITPSVGDARLEAWQRDVIVTSDLVENGIIEIKKLPTAQVPGSPSPFLTKAQILELLENYDFDGAVDLSQLDQRFVKQDTLTAAGYQNQAQVKSIADASAASATAGVIAPIQTAVTEARKGIVDGSFGLAVGLQDAAPNTLYSTQNPAAEYDPTTNRTYIAYSATSKRDLFIRYYDHATGQFSRRFFIKTYDLTNYEDNHGAPSLAIDQERRRIVIFDGVHGALLRCSTSGADLDLTTWTVRSVAGHPGTYTSVCYEPVSKALYATFRRGPIHNFQSGASQPDTHEYGSIIKSVDAGATWTQVALINTKVVFSDRATDYYVSDCDAFNGRVYVSFAIAHASTHDGPRYGAHCFYYDPADDKTHSVDGQVIDLTTAAGFDKARIIAQDFVYPIKTAVNPNGDVVVAFNRYDPTADYCRVMAAKFTAGGTSWQIIDTGVYSNYLYNGIVPAWRAGRWELLCIRNTTGDNVVASTGQRDNLGVSSGGGDLVLLRSSDAVTWTTDTTWNADRFSQPMTYIQSVRNAHPGLIALVQPVTYGVMTDKTGDAGTGEISGYNVSNWVAEVYFIFAQTNLPAQLNITRRPEVRSWHNPNYFIHSNTSAARVAPPTDWTSMQVVPDPLPRGTTSVRLRVVVAGGGTSGRILLQFRGLSYRDSDDEVTYRGEWTEAGVFTVEVPVGPDGTIQWKGAPSNPAGVTAAVFLRSHNMGSLLLGSRTQKNLTPADAVLTPVGSATVGGGAADSTPPTAPTSVTATAGDSSASLAPTGATDNVGVTGYKAYDAASGGNVVASGSAPLLVSGLTNGTPRVFYVSAIDAAGNESGRTASNSVTPAAGVPASATDNFPTTSTTNIPNWVQLSGANPSLSGAVDASGATLGGSYASVAQTVWFRSPTSMQVSGNNQRVTVVTPDAGAASTMTVHGCVRGANKADATTLGAGYWVRWVGGSTNQLQLYRAIEASGTVTTTSIGTFALSTRPNSIYVEAVGTTIKAGFNDGAASITVTDANIASGIPFIGMRATAASDLGSAHARSVTVAQAS